MGENPKSPGSSQSRKDAATACTFVSCTSTTLMKFRVQLGLSMRPRLSITEIEIKNEIEGRIRDKAETDDETQI